MVLLDVGLEDENCQHLAETVQKEMAGPRRDCPAPMSITINLTPLLKISAK